MPDHVPIVTEEFVGVADLDVLGFGRPVVDEKSSGALHIVALQENKAAGNIAERFGVDAPDVSTPPVELNCSSAGATAWTYLSSRQFFGNFDGHGRAAEADENLCGGRLHHDVRADAFDALGGFLEHAGSEANDQDDQSHFYGNRHHADQRAHRPVEKVAAGQIAPSWFLSLRRVIAKWTISVPRGASSLKRSASSGSFRAIF